MSGRTFIFLVTVSAIFVSPEMWAQNAKEGSKLYISYCTSCHGDKGKGDGVAAKSLPVKPADHTDGAVMNKFSDQFLKEIISKGGSAVGKSAFMPAWGSSLNDKQTLDIISYVRSLADPPFKAGDK